MNAVKIYAEKWRMGTPWRLGKYLCHGIKVFPKADIEEYGAEFLEAVLYYLQKTYYPSNNLPVKYPNNNLYITSEY